MTTSLQVIINTGSVPESVGDAVSAILLSFNSISLNIMYSFSCDDDVFVTFTHTRCHTKVPRVDSLLVYLAWFILLGPPDYLGSH